MLNKVMLMGRLTKDPELKYSQNGHPVCSFAVAVDRDFKTQDGKREADFINCVAWRNVAETVSKYIGKGQRIMIVGSIQTRRYTDKNGINRSATEVLVSEVYFIEPKRENDTANGHAGVEYIGQSGFTELEDDDELPFWVHS